MPFAFEKRGNKEKERGWFLLLPLVLNYICIEIDVFSQSHLEVIINWKMENISSYNLLNFMIDYIKFNVTFNVNINSLLAFFIKFILFFFALEVLSWPFSFIKKVNSIIS